MQFDIFAESGNGVETFKGTRILQIEESVAGPFIEKWHYSGRVPTGKNIYFGWYGEAGLYAVADYGIGVNPYQAQYLSEATQYNVTNDSLLELKRLCRVEPKNDELPLTAFISRCHKLLKRTGIKHIVSFSDPEYGHDGGVYKAANFKNLGKTNEEYHLVDEDGELRHRRYAYRYAKRNNISTQEARKVLKLERRKTMAKDRWYIRIG